VGQSLSWGQEATLVALGATLPVLGAIVHYLLQARRDGKRAGRAAIAEGERRIARIIALAEYGAPITDNRDEQYKLSHACADEVNMVAPLLYGGQKDVWPDVEDALRAARERCSWWQVFATKLGQSPSDAEVGATSIQDIAPGICDAARAFRPLLRKAWPNH